MAKILFLSTFCSAFLVASTTALLQSSAASFSVSQQSGGSQNQSVSVNQNTLVAGNVFSFNQNTQVSGGDQDGVSISQTGSPQNQQVSISLDSAKLRKPYILTVSVPRGTQLTGQITRNSKVVKRLNGNRASLNLSRLLSKGTQTIKVSGSYKPVRSSFQISLSGPGVQINQQTSGIRKFDSTFTIKVK